jgi:ADP-ribose pyrophosphatase YjhB (NUDIX family)
MKYCSECGSVLTFRRVLAEQRERYICDSCGRTHYQNPRVIVGCIVYCGDQILLCRRGEAPAKGQWAIPAGYLECGETLEAGAAREIWEETGVTVDPEKLELCLVVNMTDIEQVAIAFRIEFKDKPIARAGPECLDVAFMSESEIPPGQFAWQESMGEGARLFFEELRSRKFSIHLASIDSSPGGGFKLRRFEIVSATDDRHNLTC